MVTTKAVGLPSSIMLGMACYNHQTLQYSSGREVEARKVFNITVMQQGAAYQ